MSRGVAYRGARLVHGWFEARSTNGRCTVGARSVSEEEVEVGRHATVEGYLATCDEVGRERLRAIREVVREIAPDAGERISYDIPAFTIDGKVFVFMAAWKHHVSLYPLPAADRGLTALLAPYAVSKGTRSSATATPCRSTSSGRWWRRSCARRAPAEAGAGGRGRAAEAQERRVNVATRSSPRRPTAALASRS